MVRLPFVQTALGTRFSNILEKKLNTKVKVDKINPGFLNRVIIDGLTIYDRSSKKMIYTSRMAAKIDYYQLIRNGRISISSAQLFGFSGNFYRKNTSSKPNYQFMLDSLASKDKNKKSNIELSINSLIIRNGAFRYDICDRPHSPTRFNVNHIDIKDISAHITIPCYTNDRASIYIKKLSLKEKSGLNINNISFKLLINNNKVKIDNFNIHLSDTDIHLNKLDIAYEYRNKQIYIPSIKYNGIIEKSCLCLSDISCFIPALKNIKQKIFISCSFKGNSHSVNIASINMFSFDNKTNLTANVQIRQNKENNWNAEIKHSHINISNIYGILKKTKETSYVFPIQILRLENIGYKGYLSGNKTKMHADGQIQTSIGDARVRFDKNKDKINTYISTEGLNLYKLLADKHFGQIAATINVTGKTNENSITKLEIEGALSRFDYNNYQYKNITINGLYNNKSIEGTFSIDDPNGQIIIKGMINPKISGRESSVTALVRNFDPFALKITDKWKGAKFNLDLYTTGIISDSTENFFNGKIDINNFFLSSEDKSYYLDQMNVTAEKGRIHMQSDFGEMEITGKYKLNTIISSITNILHSKLPTIYNTHKVSDNQIQLKADITKSDWLNVLFKIPVKLNSPLNIRAFIDDKKETFDLKCNTSEIIYNGHTYKNAIITANTLNDTLTVDGKIKKIDNKGISVDVEVKASAINDKLLTGIKWNDHQNKPIIGSLNAETDFTRNENGQPDVHIKIKQSKLMVNDTIWTVKPANIAYNAGNLIIDHFAIEHNKQYLKINGMVTKNKSDSITVDMQGININYVLNLINFNSVDFKGYATGKAYIKSVFYNPYLYADLNISRFCFEDGPLGELSANLYWNKTENIININSQIEDKERAETLVNGYVNLTERKIDISIKAHDTNIKFLEGFCGSFMSDVKAKANGELKLHGPLDNINLTGVLTTDGNIRIKPLNTTYTLTNDTIYFLPDNIAFRSDTIRDRNGNIGVINGTLHHKNLTHLVYDLNITTKNLLCYDIQSYGNDTFYGTAYGSGFCTIKGGNGRVDIDINITPERGSFIEYNAANPENISDQKFITWNDKEQKEQYVISNKNLIPLHNVNIKSKETDISSDIRINFLINMTPEATLRVLMDKTNEDYIALNGTGSIRASYFNKGSFDMFGTYFINHGIYKLTIQNIIKKIFQFQQGGTIIFGGDPYNAALNLKALYTINGVPLSDLQIGKSFSSNNIRVDCIMNISGTPQSPHVDFDLDLPTVNNDAAQMVRTVINSEEEMNQQVVYLLGVGRFYIQKNNNSTEENDQQNQTSLAMQSILSGTISQQINTLLGNIVKNNNWTFGANISTGDEGFNNAEYEGLLSGRLLNNRLVINGQFGYRDNANATTSFIGDFDINYLLLPNGNIALKVYNQTNDRYFTKSSLNTQGIGLIMKKDFNSLMELFGFRKKFKYKDTPQ